MLPTEFASSTSRLVEAATDSAWGQWGRIGVSTANAPRPRSTIVDIESLTLASVALSAFHRRLADVAEEWLVVNGEMVSIGRLRVLRDAARFSDVGHASLIALLTRVSIRTGGARWKTFVGELAKPDGASAKSTSRKAVRATRNTPATLMLRLRLAMGLSVRADALTVLLGMAPQWQTVTDVADLTGYTDPAVREALHCLAEAGWIETTGEPTRMFLAQPMRWQHLVAESDHEPAKWRRYNDAFGFVTRWIDRFENSLKSDPGILPAVSVCCELYREHQVFFREIGVLREPLPPATGDAWTNCGMLFEQLAGWFNEN